MLTAWLALLIPLGLPASSQATSGRTAHLTCRSGRTVFHKGAIRAFVVVREFKGERGQPSSPFKTFYVCRPGSRTPRRIIEGAPFTRETAYQFKLFGQRLGWLDYSEGVQSGYQTEVGWIDLRIGRVRSGVINASEGLSNEAEEESGLPRVPADNVRYAIAGDGAVAVAGEGGEPTEWEVCVLPVKLHALGRPEPLYVAKDGQEGVDLDSIAISETGVTWITKKGQPESAPL